MTIFSMFFAKVRYLPYFCKKHAENGHFFKQKKANSQLFNWITHRDIITYPKSWKIEVYVTTKQY